MRLLEIKSSSDALAYANETGDVVPCLKFLWFARNDRKKFKTVEALFNASPHFRFSRDRGQFRVERFNQPDAERVQRISIHTKLLEDKFPFLNAYA